MRALATRLARITLALVALGPAVVLLDAAPAEAATQVRPYLSCVRVGSTSYQAVFGYSTNSKSTLSIPIGANNYMTPSSLNGVQVTQFNPGGNGAAFATPGIAIGQSVSWTVNGSRATATAQSGACGPSVSLPAGGNGTGAVLAVVVGLAVVVAMLAVRRAPDGRRGSV